MSLLFQDKFNMTDVSVSADGKWVAIEHNKESVSTVEICIGIFLIINKL